MGRRSRGGGSVYRVKSGPEAGKFKAALVIGRNAAGKPIRKVFTGDSQTEVTKALDAFRALSEAGVIDPEKMTFEQYLRRWLQDAVKGHVRPNTYACYEDTVERYVIPHLGSRLLKKLTPLDLQALFQTLADQGKSPRVRHLTYAVLRIAFKRAAVGSGWGFLARSPLEGVKAPSYQRAERKTWTKEQVETFLKAAKGQWLENLYALFLTSAIREGEALGLQQTDVVGDTMRITKGLIEVKGELLGLMDPKTDSSKRTIKLPEMAVAAVRRQRAKLMEAGLAGSPFLFPTRRGRPYRKSNLLREYKQLRDSLGLPPITIHDLRHTCATLLRRNGLDLKLLQALLGHAQYALTADTYAHVQEEEKSEAARVMDEIFR